MLYLFLNTLTVISTVLLFIILIMIPHHFIVLKNDMNYALKKWANYDLVKLTFFEFLKIYRAFPWLYEDFRKCVVKRDNYVIHFNFINTLLYRTWNKYIRDHAGENEYQLNFLELVQHDVDRVIEDKYTIRVQKVLDRRLVV